MAITTGAALLGGAVLGIAGSAYSASKSAKAAKSAAGTAASAEERVAAENRALNEERYELARQGMDPFITSSKIANDALMKQMGISRAFGNKDKYVPGRDDIRPIGQQGQTYEGEYSVVGGTPPPGGSPYLQAPGSYVLGQNEREVGIPEAGMNQDPRMLYDSQGAAPYLQAPERLSTDVIPGVQQDIAALAPGGNAYLDPVTGEQLASDLSALAPGQSLYRDPQEMIDPTQYFSDLTAGYEAFTANPIYQQMIDAGAETALGSAAAGGMARSGPTLEALRDVGQGVSTDWFNTYMGTMGDLTGMNENRRIADMNAEEQRYASYLNIGEQRGRDVFGANEQRYASAQNIAETRRREALGYNEQRNINTQNINEQRYANYMNRDEQRMINQQNTEESRYTNYMNMLRGMADPSTATNLASLGVNQGIAQGAQSSASVANINQYNLGATAAANAARSDAAGGVMNLASAYIGSQGYNPAQSTPYMPQTTGTIYGGANAPRPTSYAGYA